jgi:hypothetical protein
MYINIACWLENFDEIILININYICNRFEIKFGILYSDKTQTRSVIQFAENSDLKDMQVNFFRYHALSTF